MRLIDLLRDTLQCTEVRFASFLSVGFITMAVINPTDWKLANRTSVQYLEVQYKSVQAGIEFKKNLRVRFGKYGGLKLEYFWVVKSKKAKSFMY